MLLRNFGQTVKNFVGLPPKANVNSDAENGTALDQRANEQYFVGQFLVSVGAATGSPSSFSLVVTLEHSSDNSTWVTAPKADTSAAGNAVLTITAAGVYALAFEPQRLNRYVRVKRALTISGGTSPTVPNGTILQFGDSRRQPV